MPRTSQFAETASAAMSRLAARVLRSRALMRSPTWLYRARLGFLFGDRLLMLEHTGRKTGLPRQTVLEVMGHPAPGVYNVASGFGTRAQWFRNVSANPHVNVSVGRHVSVPADARILTQDEADAALANYVAHHRRAWEAMKPALESTLGEEITEQGTPLPILELALRQS